MDEMGKKCNTLGVGLEMRINVCFENVKV